MVNNEKLIKKLSNQQKKIDYISSVDILVIPIASACSLPSAIIATTMFLSHDVILPPADVRPGLIILAPLNTNFIAPLSTLI